MNMLRNFLLILGLASLVGALGGCSNSEHQTVEWYMQHQAEREAKLKWCNDDASRALDPDCMKRRPPPI